jgi:hypothetical protein
VLSDNTARSHRLVLSRWSARSLMMVLSTLPGSLASLGAHEVDGSLMLFGALPRLRLALLRRHTLVKWLVL